MYPLATCILNYKVFWQMYFDAVYFKLC